MLKKKKIDQCILYAAKHIRTKVHQCILCSAEQKTANAEQSKRKPFYNCFFLDADWVKLVMWSRSIVPFLVAFSAGSREKRHVKRHPDLDPNFLILTYFWAGKSCDLSCGWAVST